METCKYGRGTHAFLAYIKHHFLQFRWRRFNGPHQFWNGNIDQNAARYIYAVSQKLLQIFKEVTRPSWVVFARNVFQLRKALCTVIFKAARYASTDEVVESRLHVACFLNAYDITRAILRDNRSLLGQDILGGLTPLHAWCIGSRDLVGWTYRLDKDPSIAFHSILRELLPVKGADFKLLLIFHFLPEIQDALRGDGIVIQSFMKWVAQRTAHEASEQIAKDLKHYFKELDIKTRHGFDHQSYQESFHWEQSIMGLIRSQSFWEVLLASGFDKDAFQEWLSSLAETFPVEGPGRSWETKLSLIIQFLLRETLEEEDDVMDWIARLDRLDILLKVGIFEMVGDSEAVSLMNYFLDGLAQYHAIKLEGVAEALIHMIQSLLKRGLVNEIDFDRLSSLRTDYPDAYRPDDITPLRVQKALRHTAHGLDTVDIKTLEDAKSLIAELIGEKSGAKMIAIVLEALIKRSGLDSNATIWVLEKDIPQKEVPPKLINSLYPPGRESNDDEELGSTSLNNKLKLTYDGDSDTSSTLS
ncbi:hypothetical protein ABW21_db0207340 [Orbilia brochopaga]|nr:hypothetical protein ABW21_db0207340 [Drechslerella brochopaga]